MPDSHYELTTNILPINTTGEQAGIFFSSDSNVNWTVLLTESHQFGAFGMYIMLGAVRRASRKIWKQNAVIYFDHGRSQGGHAPPPLITRVITLNLYCKIISSDKAKQRITRNSKNICRTPAKNPGDAYDFDNKT